MCLPVLLVRLTQVWLNGTEGNLIYPRGPKIQNSQLWILSSWYLTKHMNTWRTKPKFQLACSCETHLILTQGAFNTKEDRIKILFSISFSKTHNELRKKDKMFDSRAKTEDRERRWKEIDGNIVLREILFTRYDNAEQHRKAHEKKPTLLQKSLNIMKKLNYKEMY